jgi:PDDEXK-like domain of unknown function (DUF3799)
MCGGVLMTDDLVYLDGDGQRMRDVAEERSRRIIEASRPLAELLLRDERMVVPPELQVSKPGIYDSMPQAIYHADPVPGGSLTRSGAKLLLPPSCPAKYDFALKHPASRKDTLAFDLGHAAHHMVLGIGPELVDVGGDDLRVTATKLRHDEARARGATPLRSRDFDRVMAMAAALRAHPEAAALLDPRKGRPEQAIVWTETVQWKGADEQMHETEIWRRCMIDWLPDAPAYGRLIVPDYKTADSADQQTWAHGAGKYAYHMQAAWIIEGLQRLLGIEVRIVFILQEKDPPYLPSIAQLSDADVQAGLERNWAALEVFAECRRTDLWPGYPTFETVTIPWLETRT